MANCFVFKDEAGRAQGYVQQSQCVIRYDIRIEKGGDGCCLILMFGDGSIFEQTQLQNVCQREFLVQEGKKLVGGCIVSDRKIAAATDKVAIGAVLKKLMQNNQINQNETAKVNPRSVTAEKEPAPKQFERRWPPNPCCPDAVCGMLKSVYR